MGDFLIDFRPRGQRQMTRAAAFLRFCGDMHVELIDEKWFSLVLTSADQPGLWGTYQSADGALTVALCGRVSLEEREWNAAAAVEGKGGLACRFLAERYREGGIDSLASVSGNFATIVFDRSLNKLFVITDRWGLFPVFKYESGGPIVLSSHPDALADVVGESRNWDLTSFAEFILTGRLTAPFTYYQRIKAAPVASILTVALSPEGASLESSRAYFDFNFDPQPEEKLEELAEAFAVAFRKSLAKRTLPILGRTAVALSGGLDSRTILCAVPGREDLIAFCCYDQENQEFRIARSIAREARVKFVPLRRTPEYYADSAWLGVKISAGMGCIASNHFLGFRQELLDLGVDNLLTGCYCDYVFKGLALNKRVNRWTTRESVGSFAFSYYASHFSAPTSLGRAVQMRLANLFPPALQQYDSESRVVEVEHRRVFPLCYEEDNAERTIPQRVMGWYMPIAENDLMAVRLKMSCAMRLNRRLFIRMVQRVCGTRVCRIPDANTGAPVNASVFREAAGVHFRTAAKLLRKLKITRAPSGSWLDWSQYVNQSEKVRSLWCAPNRDAQEIFSQVLGKDGFSPDIAAYRNGRLGIFLQLFTLKLWLDQRT